MLPGGDASGPLGRGLQELLELGYHPLPVIPRGQAPGKYEMGEWRPMPEWQRYRDRPPSSLELRIWRNSWSEGNIGLVMGQRVSDRQLVCLDIDATDYDDFDAIARICPPSPMVKRGSKGETRFYLAPATLKTRQYRRGSCVLLDLLTGQETRQTVVPPSIHPKGMPYVWIAGPAPISALPHLDEEHIVALEETLSAIGWREQPKREAPAVLPDEDDYWAETKQAAMQNLGAWAPALDLYDCRRARGGYEAVATWRTSCTGRPTHERKRNLSIQPNGIKDFGTNDTYSPIDLVMAARACGQDEATRWLRNQLGLDADLGPPVLLRPKPKAPASASPLTGQPLSEPPKPKRDREMPARLTRTHGLVNAIAEWICGSARRPCPTLAIGAALAAVGCAAGRLYAGPTRSGTHLYVIGLAPSGAGKDHGLAQLIRLLTSSGMGAQVGPGEFMSQSAVAMRMLREPLTLMPADELGAWLKKINSRRASPHEQAISKLLRTFWGASFQSVPTPEWAGRPAQMIHAPALSIFGASVHDEFYGALQGGDLTNGFLNRFLLLSTHQRPKDVEPPMPIAPPDSLLTNMRAIRASINPLTRATLHNARADDPAVTVQWRDSSAQDCYRDLVRSVEDREEVAPLIARTAEMALRIATIIAVGADHTRPSISLADMEWARDLALWSAEHMIVEVADYMAETEHQAEAQRILRLLGEKGRMSKTQILRSLQHRMKARDVTAMLDGLVEAGDVLCTLEPNPNGRPAKVYERA